MIKQENIVKDLVGELKQFKPVPTASSTAMAWTVTSFALTIVASLIVGNFREGFATQFLEYPRFALEIISGIFIVALLGFKVIGLSIPGTKTKITDRILIIFSIIFISLFSYSFFEPSLPVSMHGKRHHCFLESLAYGSFIMISLLYISNKRAPFEVSTTGLFGGVAACSISAVVMHTACMYEPFHVLERHLSPILIMGIIGFFAAKIFTKKI